MKIPYEADHHAIEVGYLPRIAYFDNVDDSIVWLLPIGTAPTSDKTCFYCRKSVNGIITFCEQNDRKNPEYHKEYWHLRCIQVNSRLYAFIMEKAKKQPVLLQHIILESGKFRE